MFLLLFVRYLTAPLRRVVGSMREARIRQIFQKYVPQELIDEFFAHPESMLTGRNEQIAVLFSDIRSFTTISEAMTPDRLFGAPVRHDNDASQAVFAGLDMIEAVIPFNEQQRERGEHPFNIGVGIDLGEVTVGNIGTERKMDYTVIGDRVNVASRLEGLTKKYGQPLLFSEALAEAAREHVPVRSVAKVAVKGRLAGLEIFTASRSLTDDQRELDVNPILQTP